MNDSGMGTSKNYTMLTDFYEFTMANGYFAEGYRDKIAYFDMFFRNIPDGGGYAIMAGVSQLIKYLENITFTPADIDYLRGTKIFDECFLSYLKGFKFSCDIWAVEEGTPIFPGEPIVTVRGPVLEAQFIETMILLTINHQSLIATKANRMVRAAGDRPVMEFGARRAQGYEGAVLGARAAFIGGAAASSCVMASRDFGVPASGTMAHSWVQLFESEFDAFAAYARRYPDNCTFLVDTYNVLKSGIPNVIRVAEEILKPLGRRPGAIRIDSGDIAYLTKRSREMLDEAGYYDVKIVASNSLDEFIIRDLLAQGAQIDSFGIGERLITSKSDPVFGGVYKLAAIEDETGRIIPKIKISENIEKMTTPHFKQVQRLYDKATGKAIADVLTLWDEQIDTEKPYEIFDPNFTWKRKTVENFYVRRLLTPIFKKGVCVYTDRSTSEIRDFCRAQVETLWGEVTRFEYPHKYYVDLSQPLWDIKHEMLTNVSR